MFLVSACSCLYAIYWSQMVGGEWRCSWSSADRRCSNYIWVINNLHASKVRLILETWRYVLMCEVYTLEIRLIRIYTVWKKYRINHFYWTAYDIITQRINFHTAVAVIKCIRSFSQDGCWLKTHTFNYMDVQHNLYIHRLKSTQKTSWLVGTNV